MKIELHHKIPLQKGFAFLEIEVLHSAKDMAEFLNALEKGEKLYDYPLQDRAEKEMQNLGFLDSQNSITKKGKKLIETKQRYIKECGKYEITFSLKDDIFCNRIFGAKRVAVSEIEKELIEIHFSKYPYLLLNKKNEKMDKIITTTAKIERNTEKNNPAESISYQRNYELDSKGKVIIDTEKIDNKDIKADEAFLHTQTFIQKYEEALGANWDKENIAYRINTDELNEFLKNEIIADIRTLKADDERGDFTFRDIPLSPKEENDAKYILQLCLLKDLSESYLTKDELNSKIESYSNHKGLNEFLDTKNKEKYKKDLASSLDRQKDKTAFWHYNAIFDLLPKNDLLPNKINTITLNYGEELSYADCIGKITQNRKIEAFIYIDKYFTNPYQYKKAELIVQGFKMQRYLIITEKRNTESLQHLNARAFDSMPHDRYMILKVNNKIEIWSITQSDFLQFETQAEDLTLETKGKAKGCVISNIESLSILPNGLKGIIQNFMGEQE